MGRRRHTGFRKWSAGVAADQSSGMRPDGDAVEHHPYANASDRHMTDVDYPFQFDSRGRTAEVGQDAHIRDLIEQVLFTAPGERVNRPTFGSGLMQLVFAPNSDELSAATQFLVQGALQQWLGDLIVVESVQVENRDSTLRVSIQYVVRRNQTRQTAEFSRGGTV
jgi:Bacteriophage baseplate protein W